MKSLSGWFLSMMWLAMGAGCGRVEGSPVGTNPDPGAQPSSGTSANPADPQPSRPSGPADPGVPPALPAIPVITSPDPAGVAVYVANACPFPIWIHAAGNGTVLQPDNQRLGNGEVRKYLADRKSVV